VSRQHGVPPKALVINSGSSSLKYRLLDPDSGTLIAGGQVDRLGVDDGHLEHRSAGTGDPLHLPGPFPDHAAALRGMLDAFARTGTSLSEHPPDVVGHRVVHGGADFLAPVVVDEKVLTRLDEIAPLAPLHNPVNIAGIRATLRLFPDIRQVAVFDTAFHATLPARAAGYAVPQLWRERYGVRRYGFHGISYAYVSRAAAQLLGRDPAVTNLIVLHLGNGASACAVAGGRSIDTSMGLTPLQGLVMGTRSGDIDPGLAPYLERVAGMSGAEVDHALNHESGLLGLTGDSDLREVTRRAAERDLTALAALELYCYRIRSYVGAYYAALGRVDAVVFTAGVGEHSPVVREQSLTGLDRLGIIVDPEQNRAPSRTARVISPEDAEVPVLVVPTDEEREIAAQAWTTARG
jgi:acetate kinase